MAMASSHFLPFVLFLGVLLLPLCNAKYPPMILTIVNNCPYPLWPGIQPNSGHVLLERGGFYLPSLSHRSFRAPNSHWSGRFWARTGCYSRRHGHFSCATGDCGGRLECLGRGGATPATLAQITLHHAGSRDLTSYSVSLVDGFNVPMTVTPHEGKGVCPVVGCKVDLLRRCPRQLRVCDRKGRVVACKSGCEAFNTDKLCCRNAYNSPYKCKPSKYSKFFKKCCPATYTYAHDSPSLTHDCSSPKELKIIFCH